MDDVWQTRLSMSSSVLCFGMLITKKCPIDEYIVTDYIEYIDLEFVQESPITVTWGKLHYY